ncbi:MAG: polysaccharide biosynthesis/export family protein [Acidobacteria bacterium]|nr:polysaccharide biosynthesis/export family protein [Acidobacteriota bacterium]
MKLNTLRRWLCAALMFAPALCVTQAIFAQKLPPPVKQEETKPERPAQGETGDRAKPSAAGVGLAVDPTAYLIGGEDVISIQTWRHPEFSFNMAVRPDGKISVPLVGEMQIGGMTPDAFSKKFAEAIGDYVRSPEVFVQVLDVRSKKYFIDGEVFKAGEYPLVARVRVLEALSKAGGFRDFANKKKIRILRGTQTFKFNWEEVVKGKKVEQNIYIENGDHIIVP